MSMPFYVSPEQSMRDKADYARKGVARSRSSVVVQYSGGILMVTPNMSSVLHKISEIYDRIAFAADPAAPGAASAASAAPRDSVSHMPSEKRSLSADATWSAWPPNATKPGSSETEPSQEMR